MSRRLVPQLARHCRQSHGYVPVFVDGTGVEVQGQQFEGGCAGLQRPAAVLAALGVRGRGLGQRGGWSQAART